MEKVRQYRDTWIGVGMALLAAVYYSGSHFEQSVLMMATYGPEFMPRIYSVGLLALSVILIAGDIMKNRRKGKGPASKTEKTPLDKVSLLRTLGTAGLVLLYMILLKPVGFLLSTALYIAGQICLLSPGNLKTCLKYGAFAVISAVLLDFLFVYVFALRLPTGILGF